MTGRSDLPEPPLQTVPRIVCVDSVLLRDPRAVAYLGPIRVWDTGALVTVCAIGKPRRAVSVGGDTSGAHRRRPPSIAEVELGVESGAHGRHWHGKSSLPHVAGASVAILPRVRLWRGNSTSANRLVFSWFVAVPPDVGLLRLGARVTPAVSGNLHLTPGAALEGWCAVDLRAG